eukprot:Rhum_TRINITY_DN18928_c0_g1::Rhum_TRINITY_DN18928_c0_g1_i1::g.168807::m.168807/K08730/PTDSS2; phosphatidylserine synthase 2
MASGSFPGWARALVFAVAACYVALLAWMLFAGREASAELFFSIDPSLVTSAHEERGYAQHCGIGFAELVANADVFVLAHSLGYVAKMLILRDVTLVWLVSVAFEHVEVSFQHVLKNFEECWWDHIVLDVLICNFGGLLVGWFLVCSLKLKPFPWFESSLASPRRMVHALLALAMMLTCETSLFFLKSYLSHPPEHPFTLTRMAFWFFFALVAYSDYYGYVEDVSRREARTPPRASGGKARRATADEGGGAPACLPASVKCSVATALLEVAVCLRFAAEGGGLSTPFPTLVWVPVAVATPMLLSAYAVHLASTEARGWVASVGEMLTCFLVVASGTLVGLSHLAGTPGLNLAEKPLRSLCDLVATSLPAVL